ncbi:hypothetical protein HMPREF0454_01683 [Hafnia alvei ATCC 51873]|uniref:Uncharacterized protein n=1 Tax=Hafnia alvei ATCC 51873 TaxID=1002364 RepID=G9Y544_HAFAL|nr:hypothetical protein HMPREF0454_01683 [Hafnia alvei ATCC 51873]
MHALDLSLFKDRPMAILSTAYSQNLHTEASISQKNPYVKPVNQTSDR